MIPPYNPQPQQPGPQAPGPQAPGPQVQAPAPQAPPQMPELDSSTIDAILGHSALSKQSQMYDRQMQMADVLRGMTNRSAQHHTGIGAGLAGIGDAIAAYKSGQLQRSAMKGYQQVADDSPIVDKDAIRAIQHAFRFGGPPTAEEGDPALR